MFLSKGKYPAEFDGMQDRMDKFYAVRCKNVSKTMKKYFPDLKRFSQVQKRIFAFPKERMKKS